MKKVQDRHSVSDVKTNKLQVCKAWVKIPNFMNFENTGWQLWGMNIFRAFVQFLYVRLGFSRFGLRVPPARWRESILVRVATNLRVPPAGWRESILERVATILWMISHWQKYLRYCDIAILRPADFPKIAARWYCINPESFTQNHFLCMIPHWCTIIWLRLSENH